MNVMSQKCECRIFRGFFMDQLNLCGTNWKVRCDEINCLLLEVEFHPLPLELE